MSEKIFISYARKDREKTAPITDLFRDKGYSYWMDESNIEAAGLWSEQIVQAIKECEVLVLLVSENSLASDNVHKEVMLASESNKRILPIYLEPCDLPDRFRYQLAGIQHVEFYDLNSEKVRSKICSSLEEGGEVMLATETGVHSGKVRPEPSDGLRKLGIVSFWAAVVPILVPILFSPFLLSSGLPQADKGEMILSIIGGVLFAVLYVFFGVGLELVAFVTGIISRKTRYGMIGLLISSLIFLPGILIVLYLAIF